MRFLALHQMTAMDVSPLDLPSLAAKNACRGVCIFLYVGNPLFAAPLLLPAEKNEMLSRMKDNAVELCNIEVFYVVPDMEAQLERIKPAFELGAELSAKRAVIHIHDTDFNRSVDNFAKLCEFGARYNIKMGLEFWALAGGCAKTLSETVKLLRAVDKPEQAGFALDCLHVMRTGSTPADVKALDHNLFGYGQLNDGKFGRPREEWRYEAMHDRAIPGTGEFPLIELVQAAPADLIFDVEVPQHKLRDEGVPVEVRVKNAVAGARHILERAGPPFS